MVAEGSWVSLSGRPEPSALAAALARHAGLDPVSLMHASSRDLLRIGREIALSWDDLGASSISTLDQWEALATLGALDLTVARVVEPHVDAHAILTEAGVPDEDRPRGLLGVYAAEGPGMRLEATRTSTADSGSGSGVAWQLDGDKPWCSLLSDVDAFLVTAWRAGEEARGLFLAERGPAVEALDVPWTARGLSAITSPTARFRHARAQAVGDAGWYLTRPGFAWGGIRVAAIWHGGAVGVARRLLSAAGQRPPDQIALMHLGAVDAALHRSRAVLREAADLIDGPWGGGDDPAVLALRVRQVVRASAEEVLARVARALGPAPLTGDERHARRVADLHVYLRQEHAERDQATLGAALLAGQGRPW